MHQTFNITDNARVEIRACRNRVTIVGWDDAHTVETDCDARQEGDTVIVENAHKPSLRVPRNATVIIADCNSDVRVDNIAGRLELLNVNGDAALREIRGDTFIRDLDGDLAVRGAGTLTGEGTWDGDVSLRNVDSLNVSEIDSDVSIREAGSIKIASVDGDFVAAGVHGSVNVINIDGDAVVSFDTLGETLLRAEGDVVVSLPADANADLELDAPEGDLMVRGAVKIAEQSENHLRGTVGSGGVKVQVESTDGDLIVRTIGMAGQAEHFGRIHAEMGREYAKMGQEYAEMGRRIAEDVKQSVKESLHTSLERNLGAHGRHERHRHERRHVVIVHQDDASDQVRTQEPVQAAPRGPAPGSPERQAILDAISRGEMNVDDAIKKLSGEE
jgi:hypothetical protein